MKMNELQPPARRSLGALEQHRDFCDRHIGTTDADQARSPFSASRRAALIDAVVPQTIRLSHALKLRREGRTGRSMRSRQSHRTRC
jgi:hypothetical protein